MRPGHVDTSLDVRDTRHRRTLWALVIGAAFVALTSLAIGAVPVRLVDVITALCDGVGLTHGAPLDSLSRGVVLTLRAPRVAFGVIVGAGLGLSGATLQGLFRNPLADPGILGVSSGAALAVAGSIVLGIDTHARIGVYAHPIAAALGAATATGVVWLIASSRAGVARERLVLAGVAVNALCGAGLGALTAIANDAQLRGLTFWSLGSLGASDWTVVRATALPLIVACVAARGIARSLDVFALGEHDAMVLGVSSRALFRRSVCVAALAAGAAVAFAGAIGFVGLAVPHIARMLLGSSHRLVMPGAAALGVIAVLLADAVARTAWAPAEVPVGVVSAALGAPFFVWMLLRVPRVAVAS